jgi:hypothetical protein
MNFPLSLEQTLQILESTCVAILLARIASERLPSLYKAFTAYLVIWFCQDVAPLAFGLSLGGNTYALFFFITEPLAWLLSYLVLLELFDLTFTDFPGIRSAGRLLLVSAIVLSGFVAAGTATPSLVRLHGADWLYTLYLVIERSVMILSLILLGALQVLMWRYGLNLPRNTVHYSRIYAIHFAARAIQVFAFGEFDRSLVFIGNIGTSIIDIVCLIYLSLVLTREGAYRQMAAGPKLSDQQRIELRQRLEGVNALLSGLKKKT